MNEKYWVAFSSIEEIDSLFIVTLYNHFGDIKTAFEAGESELSKVAELNFTKLKNFLANRDKCDVDKRYEAVLNRGLKILTYEDENYPYMLKQISDPPAVLYYEGDPFECNFKKTLAIVGSRRVTGNAKDALKKVMSGLAGTDLCIVSGLATGADTVAHRFALDNGLKTIGVIGGGMDNIYPANNKTMYQEIISGRGAIMSEYYPTFEPLPFRFPQRNRIVSGLSYGTLVVEAAIKSGALITANLTLEQGRELMCIPGLITNPNTEGIYKIIKNGAHIVTNSEDILDALKWTVNRQISIFDDEKESADNFSKSDEKILYAINLEPKTFDEIQKETGLDVDTLLMNLTALELNGYIEQTAGDRYKRV